MIRDRILYCEKPSGLDYLGQPVELCVIGHFDTEKASWSYYVCSIQTSRKVITADLHPYELSLNIRNVSEYGNKVKTLDFLFFFSSLYVNHLPQNWHL